MKFQIIYGFFPKVLGKGDFSHLLSESLDRKRLDYLTNTGNLESEKEMLTIKGIERDSEFDSLLILDRSVDHFTPFRTQLTYEGLLDEIFTINSSFVELDASLHSGKSRKMLLNGSDLVFGAIRDQSFESTCDANR